MIKVAIVRHNGLFYGGTEKFLQIMAASVNKSKFEVDYYTTDEDRFDDKEKYLLDNNVNVIKFNVNRHIHGINFLKWKSLWDVFDPDEYDVIQITNFGCEEYPYNAFTEFDNVCEFCVFPPHVKFPGVKQTVLNSEWLRQEWIKTGGDPDTSRAIPVPVNLPTTSDNLRKSLGIADNVAVCGFHQRADDNTFSPVQLEAYKQIESDNTCMVVLNGSMLYRKQAEQLNIKNIRFIDYVVEISPFLNTLDIYTHGRKDGETYGTVLAEAMIHKLPCMSHISKIGYNAMGSTIGPGGYVVDDVNEYVKILSLLVSDKTSRNLISFNGFGYAMDNYTYDVVIPKIEKLWEDTSKIL